LGVEVTVKNDLIHPGIGSGEMIYQMPHENRFARTWMPQNKKKSMMT